MYGADTKDHEIYKLPNTIKHLGLAWLDIKDLSFISQMTSLKSLELFEIVRTNVELASIAKGCLELESILIESK